MLVLMLKLDWLKGIRYQLVIYLIFGTAILVKKERTFVVVVVVLNTQFTINVMAADYWGSITILEDLVSEYVIFVGTGKIMFGV